MALIARITSRTGAWLTLVVAVLLSVVVIGGLGDVKAPPRASAAPTGSESTRVADLVAAFPDADVQSVQLVASREDGAKLTAVDTAALTTLGADLHTAAGHAVGPVVTSPDGLAALIPVPVVASDDNGENADTVTAMRNQVRDLAPPGMTVLVTGGPAFGADIAQAFDGANLRLLAVTVIVVALLLVLTYRSPVLWLVPVLVIGLADQLANVLATALGSALNLSFDSGIVSVLVFGAGANYAMLLISRYREELGKQPDHRAALVTAWRATVPAILASNVTVVLALITLSAAVVPGTRGLGIASAAGLLVALAAVVFLLPAVLALAGKRLFWPWVPVAGRAGDTRRSAWGRLATGVMRRPVAVVSAGLVALAVLALGLWGTTVGLAQSEQFRVASESASGLDTLSRHFPAGAAQPLTIVTRAGAVDEVIDVARGVEGVAAAAPVAGTTSGSDPLMRVSVITTADPGTASGRATVGDVRAAVHAIPDAGALVGGQQASDVDAREGTERDLRLIIPLVLVVNVLVLIGLTRSLLAPLILLGVNVLSTLATIGAGSWIGRHLLDWPALDLQVPLLSFLFLVALGIDYTIFLVHRARAEAATHGTREGMVRAVAGTGAVITSAGIVLAGVFAALGVLPLVALGQLGLIVGLGVVLDTFLVRTVLVPGLFALLGDRIWWPGGRPTDSEEVAPPPPVVPVSAP